MASISEQLKELTLTGVALTGKELGSGAYGEVLEVRFHGVKCIGKRLHEMFFKDSAPAQREEMVSRFVEECVRLREVRHPHIVQFLGVHFMKEVPFPLIVSEHLPVSLTSYLQKHHHSMPESMKTSVLCDVSLGLRYLHSQSPPIIHGDLTANNVHLTSGMTAKLADLGVARIVNVKFSQLMACMTSAYMPPEVLSESSQCDEKTDVFSFGNLILHVFTHEWPLPEPLPTSDATGLEMSGPCIEVKRRQRYLDQIDEGSPLRDLAEQCLHTLGSERPTSVRVASELESMCDSDAVFVGGLLSTGKDNSATDEKKVQHLEEENAQLRKENAQLKEENISLKQLPKVCSQHKLTIRYSGGPERVAVTTDGDVVVADTDDDCVMVFNSNGDIIRSFGSEGSDKCQFDEPKGVAVTADQEILVADSDNNRIQKFSKTGEYITSVGTEGSGTLQFSSPTGIAVHPSGQIFITEIGNSRIHVLNSNLSFSHTFGSEGSDEGEFDRPMDVAFDSEGMVYVVEENNSRIQKFQPNGEFIMKFEYDGDEDKVGQIDSPRSIAIDRTDCVYVSDGNNRISVFTTDLQFMYCFGHEGSEDGDFNGSFDTPDGLAFDRNSQLYVCDKKNNRVVVFQ